MPTPEVPGQREMSEGEAIKLGFRNDAKDLFYYIENYQVEGIINEVSLLINPSDFPKKENLTHYITSGKLGSNEDKELEDMVHYIIYGSYEYVFPMAENPGIWKIKYILDNYGRDIKLILKEIKDKEIKMKPKVAEKPKEEKKEEKFLDGAVDWLRQGITDAYNYGVDKLSSLWNITTKLIPSGVKNWVKENLFSPEKQKNTESINNLYQKLKGPEKPDFLPFYLAMQGYNKEKNNLGNKKYLTVVDYSKPVSQQRLFVINMESLTVENCVRTGHGKNSGNMQETTKFSNTQNSNQTSIGFFRTPQGLSSNSKRTRRGLFLKGMEYSNDKASARGIAVHSVGNFFYSRTEKGHRAGDSTSEGCITIRSVDNPNEIMNKIKGDSLIYSYYPDITYLTKSTMIK